jgi:hypothetical protein
MEQKVKSDVLCRSHGGDHFLFCAIGLSLVWGLREPYVLRKAPLALVDQVEVWFYFSSVWSSFENTSTENTAAA